MSKGKYIRTQVHKEKSAQYLKNFHSRPDSGLILSESMKGRIPWNKGLKGYTTKQKGKSKYPDLDFSQIIYCGCKCGGIIIIKPQHKYYGLPKFLAGHQFNNEENRDKIRQIQAETVQIFPFKDTLPERILQSAIVKFADIETQLPLYGKPDIGILNTKILIFVDGDFWHANPDKYKENDIVHSGYMAKRIWDKDKKITKYLENKGHTVLRFWEHEIHNNIEKCISEIKESIS